MLAMVRSIALLWAAASLLVPFSPSVARGGGGPENVLLVVNRNSWASLSIANRFALERSIPGSNIVWVDWRRDLEAIDVQTFRQELLGPLLRVIELRGLAPQIDYIVYSSDFPFRIELDGDLKNLPRKPQFAQGSLTGMTYLWQLTAEGNPNYLRLDTNHYFRTESAASGDLETFNRARPHGFRAWYAWDDTGRLNESGEGRNYFLSTMLGVTVGRGNSVDEVLRYLRTARRSDGTFPKGTIYFLQNDDIRSRTRLAGFEAAVAALKKLGVSAEIVSGTVPSKRDDVQGAMLGSADFDWNRSGSVLKPGSIAEHLTSFGGVLQVGVGQTPLTEFLRHGAAGASGTVTEPYAIQAKFPAPMIHAYYASGATLAEAFYQSVAGPYQLLIVGDPLCRPWANIPEIEIDGLPEGQASGELRLTPSATFPKPGPKIHRWRWYLDGRLLTTRDGEDFLSLDTRNYADGVHELRCIGADDSPLQTQGRKIVWLDIDNHGRTAELRLPAGGTVAWNEPLTLEVRSPGASSIAVFIQGQRMGLVDGDSGSLTIPAIRVGLGLVSAHCVALAADGQKRRAVSPPVDILIHDRPALPPLADPPKGSLVEGLLLKTDKVTVTVRDTSDREWLQNTGVAKGDAFTLRGYARATETGPHQVSLKSDEPLRLSVDGNVVYEGRTEVETRTVLVPIVLAAGPHEFVLEGRVGTAAQLDVRFGGPGLFPVGAPRFAHLKP